MLAGAVALPIQAGLLGRLILMMLAGGLANTSWIAGAADARDACRSGGLAGWLGRLMLMVLAGGFANTSWIAGADDSHDACRSGGYNLDCCS